MSTARIPVTVVTGFLGAGKTTLLAGLIRDCRHRRLAILVNEFGEIEVDGTLLRDAAVDGQADIRDMAGGLVAYDDDEDFLPTMQAMWERRALIDHVLIETSGLALPSAVMARLQTPELADKFVLDATLAVVDTPLLLEGRFTGEAGITELFRSQLEHADIVVLNKIDALAETDLLAAEEQVRTLAPSIRFMELAREARLDTRLTLGLHLHEADRGLHRHTGPVSAMPQAGMRPLAVQPNGHQHGGLGIHTHGLATHKHFHAQDPGWQSFLIRSKAVQDPARLKQAIERIACEQPLLRIKGFAPAVTGRLLLQAVRTRVVLKADPHAVPAREARLVFIGYHPSRPAIVARLAELTGTPWH